MDYAQAALKLHKDARGKIETKLKIPLQSKEDLSTAYTPGVAAVSQAIHEDPDAAREYTLKANTIAVITDGSAVLGLGNIGPLAALPVMEGKCALFKQFADLNAFPLCLDTQDTEEIIATIKRIAPVFGGINLEDIAAPRCFEIERRLKAELSMPVMHDDQHGTAVVVLAAMINAFELRGVNKTDARIVINGAGAAGSAIADLLALYGFTQVIVVDSKGIISPDRSDLNDEKLSLLGKTNPRKISGGLEVAISGAHAFIGVSKAGLLTPDMVRNMAERPIICALANPAPEILPQDALEAGAYIVATGRSDFPNQINNVLAFPGIFRGALDNGVSQITDAMLIQAAEKLAALVEHPTPEEILPSPFDPRVTTAVASAIA